MLFCQYVCSVVEAVGHQNCPPERLMFIDSSNVSLKSVSLRKEKNLLPLPLNGDANIKDLMKILSYVWKRSGMKTIIATLVGFKRSLFCCFLAAWLHKVVLFTL